MLSEKAQAIGKAVDVWINDLPTETVNLIHRTIPADDAYGSEVIIGVEPTNPASCPLEIGVTVPEAGSGVYLCLDRWSSVAKRAGYTFSSAVDFYALYIEPVSLSVEQTLEICQAVARGAVHLEVGIYREKLISTRGYVKLTTGRFKMHGISTGMPGLLMVARFFGYGSVREVNYEPWVRGRQPSAR